MSFNVDWATFIDKIYPVGAIYSTVAQTTAAQVKTALGGVGTWAAWGSGRVPVGVNTSDSSFNTVEKTGGAKTHKLVESELPKISGWGQFKPYDGFATGGIVSALYSQSGLNFSAAGGTQYNPTVYGFQINFGGDGAHNNLQPYITCYMWKRTA